jgi:hypothetical protein
VCGYNPCGNHKLNSGTSYQQQRRFFVTKKKDLTCPRKCFHDNLMAQLTKWREEGDQLVVCMDANKNIYKKLIGHSLTHPNGLNMSKVVGDFTGKKLGPMFFHGSKPIDRVWATSDLVVSHACIMPAGFGVGDYWMFVINFHEASLVRNAPFCVQRFSSHQLNTKVLSGAAKRYVKKLEGNIARHCLIKKLGDLHTCHTKRRSFQRKLNKFNQLSRDLMLNAERKC